MPRIETFCPNMWANGLMGMLYLITNIYNKELIQYFAKMFLLHFISSVLPSDLWIVPYGLMSNLIIKYSIQ